MHRTIESLQSPCQRIRDFLERCLGRRIAETERRESRGRQALAKQECLEAVQPEPVDDDNRRGFGSQSVL
jgi:hypothetical protein